MAEVAERIDPRAGRTGPPLNTLRFDAEQCSNCGFCLDVCPHGVFAAGDRAVRLVAPDRCMECGACHKNCPSGAIAVDSGVGCAIALIRAAITGGEPACGPSDGASSCCAPKPPGKN